MRAQCIQLAREKRERWILNCSLEGFSDGRKKSQCAQKSATCVNSCNEFANMLTHKRIIICTPLLRLNYTIYIS